jgi:hypothetical protein
MTDPDWRPPRVELAEDAPAVPRLPPPKLVTCSQIAAALGWPWTANAVFRVLGRGDVRVGDRSFHTIEDARRFASDVLTKRLVPIRGGPNIARATTAKRRRDDLPGGDGRLRDADTPALPDRPREGLPNHANRRKV